MPSGRSADALELKRLDSECPRQFKLKTLETGTVDQPSDRALEVRNGRHQP